MTLAVWYRELIRGKTSVQLVPSSGRTPDVVGAYRKLNSPPMRFPPRLRGNGSDDLYVMLLEEGDPLACVRCEPHYDDGYAVALVLHGTYPDRKHLLTLLEELIKFFRVNRPDVKVFAVPYNETHFKVPLDLAKNDILSLGLTVRAQVVFVGCDDNFEYTDHEIKTQGDMEQLNLPERGRLELRWNE